LPPKLHEMKRNEMKYAKENLKCHNQAQVKLDNLLFGKNKSNNAINTKRNLSYQRKNYPINNLKASEARRKVSLSQAISQIDFMKKLNDENDSISESSSIVENMNQTRSKEDNSKAENIDDIDHEDNVTEAEVTDENIKKKGEEAVLHKNSWSNTNLGGIKFLEQYRGITILYQQEFQIRLLI